MITLTENRNVEKYGNFNEEIEFSIKNSEKAFRILIGSLYSNPVKSSILELAQNSFDSHIQAGCPEKPFEVTLPSSFEPVFSVKDEGTGIPHSFMMDGYCRAFHSTKETSNDYSGAMGLGRMAILSICDSYTCVSITEGVKRSYTVFINKNGKPTIIFLGEQETDEPNGFTVEAPVNPSLCEEFEKNAREVLRYYKVKPIFKGYDSFEIPENKYLIEGKGFSLAGSSSEPVVIMGPYCYKVDINSITGLTDIQRAILESGLVMEMALGEVDVSANRESLHFNKPTIENIKKKINSIIPEIEPLITNNFKGKNVWEKMSLYHNLLDYRGQLAGLSGLTKEILKNENIPDSIHLGKCGLEAHIYTYDSYKEKVKKSTVTQLTYDENHVFYVTEKKIHLKAKAKKMFEDDSDKAIGQHKKIVFIKINSSGVKEFKKEYGFDLTEFPDAAALPFDKAIHTNASGEKTFKTMVFTKIGYGRYSRVQDAWAEEDLEEEDEILYVQRKGYGLADDYDKGKHGLQELQEKINKFKSITGDDTVRVFGLTARQIKDKADSWRDFDVVYKEKLEEYKKKEEEKISVYKYFRANYSDWPNFIHKLNIDSSTECFKIIEEYKQLKAIAATVNDALANETKVKASDKFNYSCADLFNKYPLLRVASRSYDSGSLKNEEKEDLSKYVNEKVIA